MTNPKMKWRKTRYTFRYVSGRPMDGLRRTDSTFLRPGTRSMVDGVPPSRWSMLPGWKRSAWRIFTPPAVIGTTVAALTHPTETQITASSVLFAGGTYAGHRLVTAAYGWKYNRTVRKPLIATLAPVVQLPEVEMEGLLITPELVRVPLAPNYRGTVEQQKDISRVVHQRLGGEWDATLNVRQTPFFMAFTPTPAPPQLVTLDMVRNEILATTQDKPVLGLGARGEVIHLDFTGEIAHLAASIGTGGGKSAFLRFLVAQFAYHGVRSFDVCDVKWVSLQGMEAVPGLRVHRTVPECVEAIGRFKAEMQARYEVMLKNPSKVFDRWILVLEEQNAFATLARLDWRAQGKKGIHPVYDDIGLILTMARQVNMNVIGVYQRMSAAAAGGGELRDQYGLKLLSRFSHQAWDTLVGTRPRGVSSSIPGRGIAIMGGSHRQVQVPFATAPECLALATAGPDVTVTAPAYQQAPAPVARDVTPRYSLADASREDWCPITYDTLRQRVVRARKLGKLPAQDTYTRTELAEAVLGGNSE